MRNPFRRRDDPPKPVETRAITDLPWSVGAPSGAEVTVERALGLVPIYSAARLLANSIASLPLHSYRGTGDSREQYPLPSLFASPGITGSQFQWKHRLVTSLALRGNAVGLVISRDRDEYPSVVEWLNPVQVQVIDQAMAGQGSFAQPLWFWQGRIIPSEDIIHIPWFTMPGRVWGLSPVAACAMAISTGLSAQQFSNDWFTNGAVPPGKFQNVQKTVPRDEADEIKERLVSSMRSRKPLVYGADWQYDPIAVSQQEARFVETLKLTATQVANIYGIPPEMIGGETGGSLTYNTVEQHSLSFVNFTLRPWLELIEDAFFDMMPKPRYVKFNADAMLRTDLAARINSYKLGREIGLYNIDECRVKEDMTPLPNGQGEDYSPLGYGGSAVPRVSTTVAGATQAPPGPDSPNGKKPSTETPSPKAEKTPLPIRPIKPA